MNREEILKAREEILKAYEVDSNGIITAFINAGICVAMKGSNPYETTNSNPQLS